MKVRPMKLKLNNYDEPKEDLNITVKTKKNNIKTVLFGAEKHFGHKLFSILKREYSIAGVQSINAFEEYQVVDLNDKRSLEGFLQFNRIDLIIVTSEILLDLHSDNNSFESIEAILNFCREYSIKMIFVAIREPLLFSHTWNGLEIGSAPENYRTALDRTLRMLDGKRDLVVSCSHAYGFNESGGHVDFVQAVRNKSVWTSQIKFDSKTVVSPVLADELALLIAENLDKTGRIEVRTPQNDTTLSCWVKMILQACGDGEEASHSGEGYRPPDKEYLENGNEISSLAKGLQIYRRQTACSLNVIYRYHPVDYFNNKSIAAIRREMGRLLLKSVPKMVIDRLDYIVPVPKTGAYYATGFSEASGVPFLEALVKDLTQIRTFNILDSDVRKKIIWEKIHPIGELVENKTIAVVDEAIFTGTTLKVVCEMLRQCNVKAIYLCIPTPECRYHCSYYVQSKKKMLLGHIREDMLPMYFGVDGVFFQNRANFSDALKFIDEVCVECFFGKD